MFLGETVKVKMCWELKKVIGMAAKTTMEVWLDVQGKLKLEVFVCMQ